jgi:hypothetical protein
MDAIYFFETTFNRILLQPGGTSSFFPGFSVVVPLRVDATWSGCWQCRETARNKQTNKQTNKNELRATNLGNSFVCEE